MRTTAILLVLVTVSLPWQSSSSYRITHTYPLGGDGSWDYIVPDPPNHRLFIGRQNRVMVVDEDSGTLLGEVTGIHGAHGTAIASATGHGFATSGNDESVVMFDLKTFKALGRIPAAEDADAIIYDAASNRVFTFNGDAHSSTVIDPKAGTLITNIPLGGKPEYGVSAGDGKVYANLTDTSEVVEIDAKAATVTRRWSTAPCKQPVAMAIDTAHHRLFSGCRSGVMADLRLPGRQGRRDGADRQRRRRRGVRCGFGRCVRLERGRHAHGDSSGRAGPVSRRPDRPDRPRLAEHGARSHEPSGLRRVREVWTGAGRRQRPRAGAARLVYAAGHRERPSRALTRASAVVECHSKKLSGGPPAPPEITVSRRAAPTGALFVSQASSAS